MKSSSLASCKVPFSVRASTALEIRVTFRTIVLTFYLRGKLQSSEGLVLSGFNTAFLIIMDWW